MTMTQLKHIQMAKADGIARITLARPKHNVLNIEMMNELNSELDRLVNDEDLKALVLLGQGPSFCAGVEVADHKPGLVHDMISVFNGIFERLERLRVPSLAAVQGACLGGGMEVAIACDMVVAAIGAVFGQPEIKLGFFPPYAAVRLPQLVGPAKAIEICTTGKRYSADDAKAMGLINHVWPDEVFDENLEKLIAEIRANSPLIIRLNKQAVKQHLGLPFAQALDGVSDLFLNTLMKTEDTLEGIASFEEKRRPQWKNR
jgi:cyclohexa-1,5-dienecarbonyl-CoA hydratase